MATDDEISEAGRKARFERWEQLGLDRVKNDLLSGGHRLVGGPPSVQKLAWEWVRMKEAGGTSPRDIQADALQLLKVIERATRGSADPVVLDTLGDLGMTADQAKTAFHHLKSKALIEANFGIFYAARLSAAGHDAIAAADRAATVNPAAPEAKSSELLSLKPGIWGFSIDLKEAARRLRRRLTKKS